jgi:hypothetical protein
MRWRVAVIAIGILISGCDKKSTGPTKSSKTSTTATKPAPAPPSQPPIRDNSTASPAKDGVITNVRLLVSTLTTKEPVRLILDFIPEKMATPADSYREQLDGSQAIAALRFEITAPGGKKHTLEANPDAASPDARSMAENIFDFMPILSIDGSGPVRWKQAVPDLFSAPGKYTIALSGGIKTDKRTLEIQSKPLGFEVVQSDDKHKSIAEIERVAGASLQKRFGLKAAPSSMPIVDDVNGNRWLRFFIDEASDGYDQQVVEMLVDPSGRELYVDDYKHFTCIAAKRRWARSWWNSSASETSS